MTQPIMVGKEEASRLVGVSSRTLDNARAAGELRAVKVGKRVLFRLVDLEAFSRRDHATGREADARQRRETKQPE